MSPLRYAPVALTKSFEPADLIALEEELLLEVDPHFEREQRQSEFRRWEYAMALRALTDFGGTLPRHPVILDVGGNGSPFQHMLGEPVIVVDPSLPAGQSIETYARKVELEYLDYHPAHAVFCISTIEHVPYAGLPSFFKALAAVLRPGGLLFLTTDCWGLSGPDTAHFHWMRERIYTMNEWRFVAASFEALGFTFLGDQDWDYHGDSVNGSYSFCCLAMVKR